MEQDSPRKSWLPLIIIVVVALLAATFVTIKVLQPKSEAPYVSPNPEPPKPVVKEPPPTPEPPKETPKPPPPVVEKPVEPKPPPQDFKGDLAKKNSELADLKKQIAELEAQPDSPAKKRKLNLLRDKEFALKEDLALLHRKLGIAPPPPDEPPPPAPQDTERQRLAWEKLRKESESLQNESKWATALEKLKQAEAECPMYAADIQRKLKEVADFLKDACAACDKALGRARKELDAKNYLNAYLAARDARNQAPDVAEKQTQIQALISDIKNRALTQDMVRIPRHSFSVGAPDNPDHPVRQLENKTFFMDSTEVTVELFILYIEDSGAERPPQWKGMDITRGIEKVRNVPMMSITHAEAEAFAKWAGKRLPTEEEWERAARFIDGRIYPWGDKWVESDGQVGGNAIDAVTATQKDQIIVRPVRSFPNGRSAEGVYDLAGNVWEWTSTRVDKTVDGAPVGYHVLKGGSFLTHKEACRSFVRLLEEPDIRHMDVGFRCVRDAE